MQFAKNDIRSKVFNTLTFILSCLLMAALFISPALISLSLGGLLLLGIINIKYQIEFFKSESLIRFIFITFGLLAVFHLIGWFHSENLAEAQRKFSLKLLFLLAPALPVIFMRLSKLQKNLILTVFIFFTYLTGTITSLVYFQHSDYFDNLILQAKPIPIMFGYGVYHIEFSILNAIACITGIYLLLFQKAELTKLWAIAIFIMTLTCIINLHVLSARTGLVSFYAGLIISLISYFNHFQKARYIKFVPALFILPIVAYLFSSSLQNRVKNSLEDFNTIVKSENPNDKSVAMRVAAWKTGLKIIKQNPILGTGLGDADSRMQEQYIKDNTSLEVQNRKNPHNQFIETALHSGVAGAFLLLGIFIGVFQFYKKNPIGTAVATVLFVSMFFESIFERQVSIAAMSFFLFFFFEDTDDKK